MGSLSITNRPRVFVSYLFNAIIDFFVAFVGFFSFRDALRERLQYARTYEDYRSIGLEIDKRDNEGWKLDENTEGLCDFHLIHQRTEKLEQLLQQREPELVAKALRTELRRNLGAIGNPALYNNHCVIGTKYFVERYNKAVCDCIHFLANTDFGPRYTWEEKEIALRNTRQSYGGSALLLSGGASLGMFHFGVVKLLFEQRLLPRVISGSSIGSLVASLVAVRTDTELAELLKSIDEGTVEFGEPFEPSGSAVRKVRRILEKGVLMDIEKLAAVIRGHVGDLTFLEAYEKTGRIVNITVSSTRPFELPMLLNYLTAPDVLLWSASVASCALPLLYESVELLCKNSKGEICSYHPSGLKYSDGSVGSDLPMRRLAELFNVNHFIASQVNPHMLLMLHPTQGLLGKLKYLLRTELRHRVLQLAHLGLLPRLMGWTMSAFAQPFEGDITILPRVKWSDLRMLLANPTPKTLKRFTNRGYRSAFPFCELIRDRTCIERSLEDAILNITHRLTHDGEENHDLQKRARLLHSTAFLALTDDR